MPVDARDTELFEQRLRQYFPKDYAFYKASQDLDGLRIMALKAAVPDAIPSLMRTRTIFESSEVGLGAGASDKDKQRIQRCSLIGSIPLLALTQRQLQGENLESDLDREETLSTSSLSSADTRDAFLHYPYNEVLAQALDITVEELVELRFKQYVIRDALMNQPAIIHINGVSTDLSKPGTGRALYYKDFITDRSGPKFGGYGQQGPGTQYFTHDSTTLRRSSMIKERIDTVMAQVYPEDDLDEAILLEPEMAEARLTRSEFETLLTQTMSVFEYGHSTQRRLSDFDLFARETRTLQRSIADALIEHIKRERDNAIESGTKPRPIPSEDFLLGVGKIAWELGGEINTNDFYNEQDEVITLEEYQAIIEENIALGDEYHMLAEGPGKKMLDYGVEPVQGKETCARVDRTYGAAIAFMAPKLYRDQSATVKEEELEELGDIITDSTSIFSRWFDKDTLEQRSKVKVIDVMLEKGANRFLIQYGENYRDIIKEKLKAFSIEELPDVIEVLIPTCTMMYKNIMDEVTPILQEWEGIKLLIETSLLFEECGNKVAQSELFLAEGTKGKLVGNMSDITPFMHGVIESAQDESNPKKQRDAQLHLEIAQLTFLVKVTRWGVTDPERTDVIGDTDRILTAEEYQQIINSKTYQTSAVSAEESIRQQIGWSNIDRQTAATRISDYQQSASPMWDFARHNPDFFKAVAYYREASNELKLADEEMLEEDLIILRQGYDVAYARLQDIVQHIVREQCPALAEYVLYSPCEDYDPLEQLVQDITEQVVDSIEFGLRREEMVRQRQQHAEAGVQNISIDAMLGVAQQMMRSHEDHTISLHPTEDVDQQTLNDIANFLEEFAVKEEEVQNKFTTFSPTPTIKQQGDDIERLPSS